MARPTSTLFSLSRLALGRLAFAFCLILVFFALGWTSATMLRLDTHNRDMAREVVREHSLTAAAGEASTRVDHWLDVENSRPYFDYLAFRAGGRHYESAFAPPEPGESVIPSPFLSQAQTVTRLHFMVTPSGWLDSPEVPLADSRAAPDAEEEESTTATALLATLRAQHAREDFRQAFSRAAGRHMRRAAALSGGLFSEGLPPAPLGTASGSPLFTTDAAPAAFDPNGSARFSGRVTPFYPCWLGGELYMLRSVETTQGDCVQGIWVNWQALRKMLADGARQRLADADFEPYIEGTAAEPAKVRLSLASLPEVALTVPHGNPSPPLVTDLRAMLALCWAFAAAAMIGIGALFLAAASLSERRATFVSAVTHELRTPLTTFQLYTEMLENNMVPEDSRKTYFATLRTEATRLIHLVENVLGFARLERGRVQRRDEVLTVAEIMERVAPRLRGRLDECKLPLETNLAHECAEARTRTDGTAVEQILFNLADNAAKYAADTAQSARLEATADEDALYFSFSDNGGGIAPSALKKLFQPFNRSAEAAAGRRPGVGLGLAFSRQLARRLGGDLTLKRTGADGVEFCLRLPRLHE